MKLRTAKRFCKKNNLDFKCLENNIIQIEYSNKEYLILTDKQANLKAKESILETLWAFNESFILDYIGYKYKKVYSKLQDLYEDANEIIKDLLIKNKSLDKFIKDAIISDGRSHFIASYDGKEIEFDGYFIYRLN